MDIFCGHSQNGLHVILLNMYRVECQVLGCIEEVDMESF